MSLRVRPLAALAAGPASPPPAATPPPPLRHPIPIPTTPAAHPAAAEAALALGEDPCAQEALQSYDLALHIGAVFILLGVSLLGSLGPVGLWLAGRRGAQGEGAVATCIRLGTYFGAGA